MEKFLNKFYEIIDKIGKRNFILIIFIFFALLTTTLYQTFSIYTESEGLSIVDGIETYSFILNANNETNSVTIAAGESKNVDITVYNESVADLQYKLYSSAQNNVDDSNIFIGYLTNTANLPSGIIPSETSYVVTVKIYNYSNSNKTINFGVLYGLDNGEELALSSGQYEVEPLTIMKNLFASESEYTYFRESNYLDMIVSASFVDLDDISGEVIPNGPNTSTSWNVSANGSSDDSVIAWLVPNIDDESMYDLYIGAKEKIYVEDLQSFFAGMTALTNIDFTNLDTGITTGMERFFKGCTSLTTLDVSSFNTSNVTSMLGMFYECSGLTSVDVSSFNTAKVTSMRNMFGECNSLTSLSVSNFITNNVTDMSGMFSYCKSLTSLNVSNFNTEKVTNMDSMFGGCSELATLDLSSFGTSNVTNMASMFSEMSNLIELIFPEKSFETYSVTTMSRMFSGCSSLTSIYINNFDTSSVTNMNGMFRNCSKLTSLNVSDFDTSKVTDMSQMFYNCINLTELDLSSFDTSNVTDMSGMFYNNINDVDADDDSKLTTIKLSSNFNTSKVTTMIYMFYYCNSLISLDLSSFNTSSVTDMGAMFEGCSSLENLTLDLVAFDTSNVTNFTSMFYNCSKLNTEIVIRSTVSITPTYDNPFTGAATEDGSSITVYYTSDTESLVKSMVPSTGNITIEEYTA